MILFKKEQKEIGIICNNIYDLSLDITERLNKLLSGYGYTKQSEYLNSNTLFCSITSMFCYYFFEDLLKYKYNYDEKKIFIILDCLFTELSTHIHGISKQQCWHLYIDIKKMLNSKDESIENYEYVAINYMAMSIGFNKEEIESILLINLYQEFDNIINDKYNLFN